MPKITRKEFIENLENFLNKRILVQNKGYVGFKIVLEKLKYEIIEDILYLKDIESQNLIEINLNIINYIESNSDTIICLLDDNMDTVIEIKEK